MITLPGQDIFRAEFATVPTVGGYVPLVLIYYVPSCGIPSAESSSIRGGLTSLERGATGGVAPVPLPTYLIACSYLISTQFRPMII